MVKQLKIQKIHLANRAGFSLIEVLIAMAIAMILMSGVVMLFTTANRSYNVQDQLVSTEQNVRAAMEIMAFEFRMAGFIPPDNLTDGANPITTDVGGETFSDGTMDKVEEASATTLTFTGDLNPDDETGTVDYAETVRYTLNGTDMQRTSWTWDGSSWNVQGSGAVTLATDITQFALTYTFEDGTTGLPNDSDSNPDNDTDDIRAVTINLTGQTQRAVSGINASTASRKTRTLQSYVRMRNMGLDSTID